MVWCGGEGIPTGLIRDQDSLLTRHVQIRVIFLFALIHPDPTDIP